MMAGATISRRMIIACGVAALGELASMSALADEPTDAARVRLPL
jgi:hypothetical protein